MSERRVDEPPLPFSGCPDRVAIPAKRVLGLAVPIEVADVPRLQVDRMAVKRMENRNACVRTGSLFRLHRLSGLRDEKCGKHSPDENHWANDPDPTMLHDPSLGERDADLTECPSQALDSNDNEPPFIDGKQTFSAKTPRSACWGTVPVAYLTQRCRRPTQPQVRGELRASSEGESLLLW